MGEVRKYPGQLVFGLDIGTRSIVGTVGYKSGEKFTVVAQRSMEHETRAMLDGQIHDINRVGNTINLVKKELESVIGQELHDVCIAAAGRVLKTVNVHVEHVFEEEKEISAEDIYELDSKGIEAAYSKFNENNMGETDVKFYCVGYSVVKYHLNHYPIGNLEGHKAKEVGVDLIATFLPEDVVDGLYKAVRIANLEVVNMTLEPIAAIQLAIPEKYRMLNIALVDVGAGTSDISITQSGSIIAYGMIPIAGDALTEVVAEHCLVDFGTAEMIKRGCGEKDSVEYQDIIGLPQTITKETLQEVVQPVIDNMTKQVADKIKELNGGKTVSAVFVVGGGGKMPNYTKQLASYLDVPEERCVLRGEEVMKEVEFKEKDIIKDSLLVTPIGICLSFYENNNNFIFVTFNETRIKLYDNSRLAVVDAAMQADFSNENLFPKRGKALTFSVDGKQKMVRGELGEVAVITVNGSPADIYTQIRANDVIKVTESTAGNTAKMTIGKLPEFNSSMAFEINGQKITVPKFVSVNGSLQSEFYEIQENDQIEILNYYTVRQISEFMDVIIDESMNIYVNNKRSDMNTKVYENFSVIWTMEEMQLSDVEADSITGSYADLPDDDGTAEADRKAHEAEAAAAAAAASQEMLQEIAQQEQEKPSAESQSQSSAEAQSQPAAQAQPVVQPSAEMQSQPAAQAQSVVQPSAEAQVQPSAEAQSQPAAQAQPVVQTSAEAQSQPQPKAQPQQQSGVGAQPTANTASPASGESISLEPGMQTISVIVNHNPVILTGKKSYVFVDVFDKIDFDLSKPQGRSIATMLNGREAQYMEALKAGDVIEIFWREM